ncbi:MAG TPA: POTRA domain-containing protein [Candidatus Eremiobacteraceae bacterium]|nr:POTRA domain-containing protein [Candidatus Eremiobacteraceae bacterium]
MKDSEVDARATGNFRPYMRLPALLVLCLVTCVSGQVQVQGPSTVYEGQNVSAVALIGNPHRDLEPLRPVPLQKAGEPYSQAKVEASVQALQQAGHFPKVTVSVVPDLSGIRVSFLLEPAYFIGIVDFPGAAQVFSYTRLLQVADLPDEDPYDPARVAVGEQALQDFLKRNGYFQSQIQSDIKIDDAHQLVNVRYVVKLSRRARIAKVEIQGAEGTDAARLLHSTRTLRARLTGGLLKTGKPYTAERLKAAEALIKRTLSQQHRLASSVQQNPPQYYSESNRVDVSFKVELGPVVIVRATGAKLSWLPFLSGREMRKLIPIYSERSIDSDLVEEGQENLVDYFQKKGYFDVAVKVNLTRQADQVLLVYEIDRAKKLKVGHISFHGNHEISDAELLPHAAVKKARIWNHGSVSQKLLKQSVANLEAIYRDKGYEDVKITSSVMKHDPKIDVSFEITEGKQTMVGDINVTGNDHIPYDQLTAPKGFELRAGAPYSPRRLAEDRNRISATYLDRGYPNAEVKATVSREAGDPRGVDVTYAIDEHQLVRVGPVVYLGQKRTQLSLIEKTAQLPAESPMRKVQMLGAETRLYDLNIFDWSSVGPRRPITDQTEETALVKVHESKRNEIIYGFGFEVSHRGGNVPSGTVAVPGLPTIGLGNNKIAPSQATYASPRGSIEFDRRNMRGLGETLGASILLSRLDQRFLTNYAQPHFIGSQWSSLTSFSLERTTENPLFAASLGDMSFQLERLLNRKKNTRLQLRYDFNKTVLSQLLVPELVLPEDQRVRLSTFSATLIRDTRDKPLDAHRGIFSTISLGITPTALGSSANFARFFGQFATYKSFHSVVFANSIRLGLAESFAGSFIPTSQLYFSGGGTSLRGFPIDEAGPQRIVPFCTGLQNQTGCVNVTVPVGGNELFILNSELRFPLRIMKALGGVVFYDGGNVYSAINLPNFVNNYTNTVGIGLRYSTPIGPIRIDLGHNLNPVPGINPTQYFITIGQAF